VVHFLGQHPVVALLGPRQVGKTTLAHEIGRSWKGPTHRFDLEDPIDLRRLEDPGLTLRPLTGLVILDEVQQRPDLFPLLRVLADRPDVPARFLVLGSASPSLVKSTSESLAGRVAFHDLGGLSLDEVGIDARDDLWLRGGFPRSFLAVDVAASYEWREQFVRTFLERDLAQLGIGVAPTTMRRFWTMLAHYHGQIWNGSELARAFGVSDKTVRSYLDHLAATFVVRVLQPWFENLGKRQVRSPKVYVTDPGLLHTLLGIRSMSELEGHPKVGASWEGFALHQLIEHLGVRPDACFYWATHGGAELDLLVIHHGQRHGYELKRTEAPAVTRSMRFAMQDLRLDRLDVIHAGDRSWEMAERIRAVPLSRLADEIARG
jgi:predicted AAA+ superfamily ATPase